MASFSQSHGSLLEDSLPATYVTAIRYDNWLVRHPAYEVWTTWTGETTNRLLVDIKMMNEVGVYLGEFIPQG